MNRKIVTRILESERSWQRLANAYIKEADDGLRALEITREERELGHGDFDFILMDYIMVGYYN